MLLLLIFVFFFSSRRRHTRWPRDWSSDVCSSDLEVLKISFFVKIEVMEILKPAHIPSYIRILQFRQQKYWTKRQFFKTPNSLEALQNQEFWLHSTPEQKYNRGIVVLRSEERRVGKE